MTASEFYADFINQDNTDGNGGCYDISNKAKETLQKIKELNNENNS